MKFKELMELLINQGWKLDRIKGSHNIMKHPKGSRPIILSYNSKHKTFGAPKIAIIMRDVKNSLAEYERLNK